MKSRLEQLCQIVDAVLAARGLTAQVVGGCLAGSDLLLSLNTAVFVNTAVAAPPFADKKPVISALTRH